MSAMEDLMTDAKVIADATANAEGIVLDRLEIEDAEGAVAIYDELTAASKVLTEVRKRLATAIGEHIGPSLQVINGHPVKRHADMSRKNWDHDALLRMVLDSRIADANGEPVEETPLDKVKSVWGLKGYQASVTKLRDRGLDPDEFSESEFRGYRLADR